MQTDRQTRPRVFLRCRCGIRRERSRSACVDISITRFHMSSNTTTTVLPTTAAAFMQPTPGGLAATYVESDTAQRGQAKIAHLLGIFGIVGKGIYYYLKHSDAGTFARDQMKEAFNFH